ncbi:alpha-mannosidase [Microbacteriaceae bacterium VKM Ac-2854]|nr:alpha-mannosidase [Microbacteriaceae bacterium VKM Ac-2854]
MHNNTALVEARIVRFVSERLEPAAYRAWAPATITAWEVPDEPVPFAEAVGQGFAPFAVGQAWGKPWGTTWFRVTGTVPQWQLGRDRLELVVDLGFLSGQAGFQAEGLAFSPEGEIIKAIEPFNSAVPLAAGPGESFELLIEAASNPDVGSTWTFAPTPVGDKATAGTAPIYALRRLDIAVLDTEVWALQRDVFTLYGLMRELPAGSQRRAQILRALERMVDVMDPDAVSATAAAGRAALAPALAKPANASAHRIVAVGHAHIDSAWLWPVRETIRKCARTFSNVLQLMDENPTFVFACSSAQQFAWMKEFYPGLFERIRVRVREGRFVPVGGMWVESDTNLPGGEALVRQFVHGKGFFLREFGVEPLEVWLPDSFGYSGALPQIARAAGARSFLTQKLSWNETDTFPHHTFRWEGIDGTRVFTHFPPVDTYNSILSGEELARAERQFAEKGEAGVSLVPFGFGDGGGGPTREMLAAAERTASLEGSPSVRIAAPAEFFAEALAEYPDAPVWSGELYLEFHRGTYTSQARTKRGNRRSEHLLREAELWASTATVRSGAAYPYETLDAAWRTVLLQQFHDILPGSSIAWVHQVAEANYAAVAESLEGVIAAALGDGELLANASPYPQRGIAPFSSGTPAAAVAASVEPLGEGFVLANTALRAVIDGVGRVTSLVERATGREVVAPGAAANELQLFRDTPNQWDAWDIDAAYNRNRLPLGDVEVTASGAGVLVRHSFGASTIAQRITLGETGLDIETTVDWHESQKLLKLAFALDVHADRASSEIQFGHIERPTHSNTSWDAARFETSAHRWVHVGESGWGAALANDGSYGHDVTRTTREDGGTTTLLRSSLLRAPRFPDPQADQGEHVLRHTLVVGADVLDAARAGYTLNLPLRPAGAVAPLLRVEGDGVLVEAVKLAEDRSGDVIVRLYEAAGARSTATLHVDFPHERVWATDLLEREIEADALTPRHSDAGPDARSTPGYRITLRPFRILTLRIRRATAGL